MFSGAQGTGEIVEYLLLLCLCRLDLTFYLSRFLDLKPVGPICGSSTCVKDAVDKFDDIVIKKEMKKQIKNEKIETEMYVYV